MRRVQGFSFVPDRRELVGNPYWERIAAHIEQFGLPYVSLSVGVLSVRDLIKYSCLVRYIHLHYVQQNYAYGGRHARLRWVLRFARNLIVARMLGYRVVFTLHNLQPTRPLEPGWVDHLGHLAAVWLSNSVIVHCNAARGLLAAGYGRRHSVRVIPHPHYIGAYPNEVDQRESRARLALESDSTAYVFFGGIRPNKGVVELLRAFAAVPGQHLRLVVAGKPWPPESYLDEVRALAAQDERVRLVAEPVPDEDVQVYLNAADAVVLPFSEILTSGSTILAMSFGRAVIVPQKGCLAELVTDDVGITYEPSDPTSLRKALTARTRDELQMMGQRAYAAALRLDPARTAALTVAAYRGG